MDAIHNNDFYFYVEKIWKKQIHEQLKHQWFYTGEDHDFESNDILLQFVENRWLSYKPTVGDPLKFINWFYDAGVDFFIDYFKMAPEFKYGSEIISKRINASLSFDLIVKTKAGREKIQLNFWDELKELQHHLQSSVVRILREQFNCSSDPAATAAYLLNVKKSINEFRPAYVHKVAIYQDGFKSALFKMKDEIIQEIDALLLKLNYLELNISVDVLSPQEKKSLLGEIYYLEIGGEPFINDEETSLKDFEHFFSKGVMVNDKIYINSKNNEAAVVLDRMKALGFNIIYEELESFKKIQTRNGKYLTASYISKAISEARKKHTPSTLNEINSFFHDLESRYFYNKK